MARENPDDSYESFKNAREAMGDVIEHVLEEEGFEAFCKAQGRYFDLRAGEAARDPEFQGVDMSGTRLNVPQARSVFEDPSVTDDGGEWVAATRHDDFRVLDGFEVLPPEGSPFTTHAVTLDHVVTTDGDVRCEVNGVPLSEMGQRAGSYIK